MKKERKVQLGQDRTGSLKNEQWLSAMVLNLNQEEDYAQGPENLSEVTALVRPSQRQRQSSARYSGT